jgi:8-oxo-dGDP phosphatase
VNDDFVIAARETILSSYVFDVERRRVSHGGETFTRDVAVHPGAVAIVCRDADDRVGLIRQYRATVDAFSYEIPAGTRDVAGEEALRTAQRELREEMGLEAASWRLLGHFLNSPGWTDQIMTIFEARGLTSVGRRPEGPEENASTVHWMTRDDLRALRTSEPYLDATMTIALHVLFGDFLD